MDYSQHVFMGRHRTVKRRFQSPAVAYDQQNWCLQCPRHRKNGKRDVEKVSYFKSNLHLNHKLT